MPDLERVHGANEDVVVLAVNVRESASAAGAYIEEGGYSFPVALDQSGQVATQFRVTSYPTTYVIGPDGRVIHGMPGLMSLATMEEMIDMVRKEVD